MNAEDWDSANQRYLMAALEVIRIALEQHASQSPEQDMSAAMQELESAESANVFNSKQPPALTTLAQAFDLSRFEQQLLLLCAGVELDARFTALYAIAQSDQQRAYPTFSLALAVLPEAHWSVLSPQGPLRRWRLIDVSSGAALTTSALRIDERILCYLTGLQPIDARLMDIIEPLTPPTAQVASHQQLAAQAASSWEQAPRYAKPIIQLYGSDPDGQRAVALIIGRKLSRKVQQLQARALPANTEELATLTILWQRECKLMPRTLVLDLHKAETATTAERLLHRLAQTLDSLVIVLSYQRTRFEFTQTLALEVPKPTREEQVLLWRDGLNGHQQANNTVVDELVSQFDLGASAIQSACGQTCADTIVDDSTLPLKTRLWHACRQQSRPQLGAFVEVIDPLPVWEDLVLPEAQQQTLCDIIAQVRQRRQVYDTWGFAATSRRGLGISALFVGPSGTGKTLAAEVIAKELQLDLYRIDLSQVVSKYIGETEKNLSRVFDAAEQGSAVLLFDEADALFGKRTEVQDSHDRYANIEVSYLLQKMESYKGLAILTSNMKEALDQAFLRRLRFVVHFPFPDARLRTGIWQRIIPEKLVDGLDFEKLAQLNIAGGNIRNIALNAAFLAADQGRPLSMAHVQRATCTEYLKLEKSLTNAETRGWVV